MKPRIYNDEVQRILDSVPLEPVEEMAKVLHKARIRGNRVYVFGNGGSSTTATHIAGDLFKGTQAKGLPNLRATALNSDYLITALANDISYTNIFKGQLDGVIEKGDVAIGISGSGQSMNVMLALTFAKNSGAKTIALTGFGGGCVKNIADICLIVPCHVVEQVEDIHLMVGHMLTTMLRDMDA